MSGFEHGRNNQTEVEVAGAESGASVDKVRDILFGSQIKQFETRFNRLEENLRRETIELKETMRRRFESIEGFFKSETEALSSRLRSEREERAAACHTIDQDLKATHDTLGRQIHALDASTADAQSGLRLELMAESRKLLDEIAERHEVVRSLIEYRIAEIRYQKADRTLLSTLLADLGAQLSDDSQLAPDPNLAVALPQSSRSTSTGSPDGSNGSNHSWIEAVPAPTAETTRSLAAATLPPHLIAKLNPGKASRTTPAGKGRSTPRSGSTDTNQG
jgi:hypothetical protein